MNKHATKLRGLWIPVVVWRLLRDGTLTPTDLMVLSTIDNLIDEENGIGCYASNAYLSEVVGVKRRQIRKIVNKLKQLQLLADTSADHNRHNFITPWSSLWRGGASEAPRGGALRPLGNSSLREESDRKEDTRMPFFDLPNKPGICLPFDNIMADKLHQIVVTKFKRRRKWSKRKWSNEIRLLREEVNNDTDRIEDAIAFLGAHPNHSKLPRISSAKALRQRFDWIEDIINREKPFVTPDHIRPIISRIAAMGWSAQTTELERAIVQSAQTHEHLVNRIHNVGKRLIAGRDEERKRRRGICSSKWQSRLEFREMVLGRLSETEAFVYHWFEDVHRRVFNWSSWNGKFGNLAFTDKSADDLMRTWSQEFCGSITAWLDLMEWINANRKARGDSGKTHTNRDDR